MKVIKLKKDAIIPKKQNENSPGYNLYSSVDLNLMKDKFSIDTGIIIEIPKGYFGKIVSKDILFKNYSISIVEKIIESKKREKINVIMQNNTDKFLNIKKGDIIAQLIIYKNITLDIEEIKEKQEEIDKIKKISFNNLDQNIL